MEISDNKNLIFCFSCKKHTHLLFPILYKKDTKHFCIDCLSNTISLYNNIKEMEKSNEKKEAKNKIYTCKNIYYEFIGLLAKMQKDTNICPACFNVIYDRRGNSSIYNAKCYRCGIMTCSVCKKIVSSEEHLQNHKELLLNNDRKEKMIEEIKESKDKCNFTFLAFINNALFALFAKNLKESNIENNTIQEEINYFTRQLVSNIQRIETNGSLFISYQKKQSKMSLLDIIIEYCILRIASSGVIKKELSIEERKKGLKIYLNNAKNILTVDGTTNVFNSPSKKVDTKKRKIEDTRIITVSDDDNDETLIDSDFNNEHYGKEEKSNKKINRSELETIVAGVMENMKQSISQLIRKELVHMNKQ